MTATRAALQRVAAHVLARRRFAATGRFGLRVTPGGFGTPAFGDDGEVLRISGTVLVHERGGRASHHDLDGTTLAGLAAFAGVDLDPDFAVGHDTPPLGDPDEPFVIDAADAAVVADWYDRGWRALDAVAATATDPSAIQLWPEHFDVACDVAVGAGGPGDEARCNLGASPGDGFHDEPYLYVGPWDGARPGPDDGYWNAPFGAVLARADVLAGTDPVAFLHEGLHRLMPR